MVNVRMVTGDHFEVARYVALKAGIINATEFNAAQTVMTGEQFRKKIGFIRDPNTGENVPNYTINA